MLVIGLSNMDLSKINGYDILWLWLFWPYGLYRILKKIR